MKGSKFSKGTITFSRTRIFSTSCSCCGGEVKRRAHAGHPYQYELEEHGLHITHHVWVDEIHYTTRVVLDVTIEYEDDQS